MRSTNSLLGRSMLAKLPEWFSGMLRSGTPATAVEEPLVKTVAVEADAIDEPSEELALDCRAGGEIESAVDEMLSHHRYALLLRPQLAKSLTVPQLARTRTALAEGMCLVPEGQVVLKRSIVTTTNHEADTSTPDGPSFHVEAFYLDRYPVTNGQYLQFLSHGGYEQMAIWDAEIWPALLDFVDSSGHPGPRYWRNGRFPRGEEHHPVVGICWYEAVAYARWVGKRLPTDAEWVKAGSWPVSIQGHPLLLRRYPWGEAMDRSRANLWGSGPGRTTSVFEFPGGVSVGGVQQLIGNVWEWTADAFTGGGLEGTPAPDQTKLKSIRGGAFDTYLDSQATCHFQSADAALSRKHNVGFRCAISLCDVAVRQDEAQDDEGRGDEGIDDESNTEEQS